MHKARKGLNLLKVISRQKWGEDLNTLRLLAFALVRSRLVYAQETFFNAPNHLLNKIESIDCSAFKIALGVPLHAINSGVYNEVGILPLREQRQVSAPKFVIKSCIYNNYCQDEVKLDTKIHFAKRASTIQSNISIYSYVATILQLAHIRGEDIVSQSSIPTFPLWKLPTIHFDVNTSKTNKSVSPNILKVLFYEEIQKSYSDFTKIFTDGSVLDDGNAGSAFLIPTLNIHKSFYLGKNISIFTAEIYAILEALTYVLRSKIENTKLLLCVDSMSAISSIKLVTGKIRPKLLHKILHVITQLSEINTFVTFYWVPAHCGIFQNEKVDSLAKHGAMSSLLSTKVNLEMDYHEYCSLLNKVIKEKVQQDLITKRSFYSIHCLQPNMNMTMTPAINLIQKSTTRKINSLMFRLRLNAYKVKYVKTVKCLCGAIINTEHILLHCPVITTHATLYYNIKIGDSSPLTLAQVLNDTELLTTYSQIISGTGIGHLV